MGLLQQKNRIIAIVAGILVVSCAAWYGVFHANAAPLSEREIATRVLGEYIRKRANAHAALIISNPYAEMASRTAEAYRFEKAGQDGLRKGLAPDINVKIGYAKLKPDAIRDVTSIFVPPNTTTPLSYLVDDSSFDDLVRKNPDCDVIVSLIGLPANAPAAAFWQKNGSPRIALLLPDFSVLGDPSMIRHAFKSGKIVAAVITKPGASTHKSLSSDYKAEFERRFVLVTADNIDQLLPQLLR